MSILNRPGWASRKLINEGRVYQDELKRRILDLFDRPSLGRSPNYVVDNIYNTLRSQNNNEDFDTSSINDEDIIKITIDTAQNISRGQCKPQLKIQITTVSGEEESEMARDEEECDEHEEPVQAAMMFGTEQPVEAETEEAPESQGSEEYQEMESEEPEDEEPEDEYEDEDEESIEMQGEESAETVNTPHCKCAEKQSTGSVGQSGSQFQKKSQPVKEAVKLSPKAVNQLLQENYIKSRQHKFNIEERYRF